MLQQEKGIEAGKPKKEGGGGGMNFKVPGVGLLSGIFGFISKFLFGALLMKLVDLAPKLAPLLNNIANGIKFVDNFFGVSAGVSSLLNGLASFIDFGYQLVDGAEKVIGQVFGVEGAEKFKIFMENVRNFDQWIYTMENL